MTTARENEILTRVGPGTPMGDVMRQYWHPIAMSDEVKTDGDPVRIMILGEPLIAFRDTSGRIGVMDHRCAHRCASLFFGRNEKDGIRCVYHGWKFDVDGNCVDMPNVPKQQDVKHRVHAKAYKAIERYGVIWIYMGERQVPPPFPDYELNDLAEGDIRVQLLQQEYNWLQGLENDLDTSHFGFLHLGGTDVDDLVPGDTMHYLAADPVPQFHIEETPLGMMYGAYRPADETNKETHWRLAQLVVPCWVIPPAGMLAEQIMIKGYIPMDDTHTMVFTIQRKMAQMRSRTKSGKPIPGLGFVPSAGNEFKPNTTDWFGRWRLANDAGNDWLIDREAQRNGGVFSGISGLNVQDAAVGGMLGILSDRTLEHLVSSDAMIVKARRKMLALVEGFAADKTMKLPGVDDPSVYRGHRAGNFLAPSGKPFRDAYEEQMRTHANAAPRWAAE
ncbi:MAG TPA: Rieske 2Fe-2S domain-containing protein [Stellaceae bacterium]|jgi:phenylpropionate dioxygenase-like ring-hydroxylating dioxygenase large terminal subunit|nr:Rieske 2Fe-2S domain-containing protein [Stellaceae bacterium]